MNFPHGFFIDPNTYRSGSVWDMSMSWWRPTSRRAGWTSWSCRWSSTTTCRSWPKTTFTGSAARVGPDAAGVPCHSSRHQIRGCCAIFSGCCRRRSRRLRSGESIILTLTRRSPRGVGLAVRRATTDSSDPNEARSGKRDVAVFKRLEPRSPVDHLRGGMHVTAERRPRPISNQSKAKASTSPTDPRAADRPVRTPPGSVRDRSTRAPVEATTGLRPVRSADDRAEIALEPGQHLGRYFVVRQFVTGFE